MPMDTRLAAARLKAATDRPYLATALWAVVPVEQPGLGTMGVDARWRLYYDPGMFEKWTVDQVAGVLIHEIGHLLRDHAERCEGMHAEHDLYNVAGDLELNDDLLAEGITLPPGALTPQGFKWPTGLFAEEYYMRLLQQKQQGQEQKQQGQEQKQQGQEQRQGQGAPTMGDCGSCADGQVRGYELPGPGEGRVDPVSGPAPEEVPHVDASEAELIRRDVARRILEHMKSRGNIGAGWRRWAEERLTTKIDWRRELASCIRHACADVAGMVDYSYKKPSRRQAAVPQIVLPSLRRPVPSLAVVVDTSGSMSDVLLAQALAEIQGILKHLGYREGVTVLAVDAAVHTVRRVVRAEQVILKGGGGTDMRQGLTAAAKLKPRPQICVVLTDGYTPWPDVPPAGMRVVVGLLSKGTSPPWAKTVVIEA